MDEIIYQIEPTLTSAEFIDVLTRSTLSERRPVDRPDLIERMLANANVIVTARNQEGLLVGVSRAMTDFGYATYLSDLAVRESHQRRGIGRELIRRTQTATGGVQIVLLSAPQAAGYYPRLGFEKHDSAWVLPAGKALS